MMLSVTEIPSFNCIVRKPRRKSPVKYGVMVNRYRAAASIPQSSECVCTCVAPEKMFGKDVKYGRGWVLTTTGRESIGLPLKSEEYVELVVFCGKTRPSNSR